MAKGKANKSYLTGGRANSGAKGRRSTYNAATDKEAAKIRAAVKAGKEYVQDDSWLDDDSILPF